MSVENQEVPKLSILEQLKQQHHNFVQQKEFAQNNLNQLVGAVFACEMMIKKIEAEEAQKGLSTENLGDQGNGEAEKQVSDANPV